MDERIRTGLASGARRPTLLGVVGLRPRKRPCPTLREKAHVSILLGLETFALCVSRFAPGSGRQPGSRGSFGPPRILARKPLPVWPVVGQRRQRQIDRAGRVRRAGPARWSAR